MEQIFKPSKQLTFDTAQANYKRLTQMLRNHQNDTLRLDLGEVTECDSAGLALLIAAKSLCRKHSKTLLITGETKSIFALAEFCGVQDMLAESIVGSA